MKRWTRDRARRGWFVLGIGVALGALTVWLWAMNEKAKNEPTHLSEATLGGGCFWCLEAVFERVDGVQSVINGYAGGTTSNPTYQEVCTGETGHAEVVRIRFDPAKVSYEALLELFWRAHDPTTLNRQGADVGTQYRSIILYHDEAQRAVAERSREAAQARFTAPIVTEIVPLKQFYPAEPYHQDFYRNHRAHGYCRAVIAPKLKKLAAHPPAAPSAADE